MNNFLVSQLWNTLLGAGVVFVVITTAWLLFHIAVIVANHLDMFAYSLVTAMVLLVCNTIGRVMNAGGEF